MSYKMTDNDVKLRLSCVTLGRDTKLMDAKPANANRIL